MEPDTPTEVRQVLDIPEGREEKQVVQEQYNSPGQAAGGR